MNSAFTSMSVDQFGLEINESETGLKGNNIIELEILNLHKKSGLFNNHTIPQFPPLNFLHSNLEWRPCLQFLFQRHWYEPSSSKWYPIRRRRWVYLNTKNEKETNNLKKKNKHLSWGHYHQSKMLLLTEKINCAYA